ncbi:hypothetical protein [Terricaulis sp.]|uniref:hypothetical protein n=1 Tax=Terricaulis sp. TaxID=2768686 RepID=UPI00378468AF
MHRRTLLIALTTLAGACTTPRSAPQRAAPAPDQAFQTLKGLVGAWQGTNERGRTFLVDYRLVAGESVLVETWTMSPTRTSMTVYHMDGDALIATHYCPLGNQPRLQYRPEISGQRLEFRFRDATNLPNERVAHEHAFWIEINGDGTFARNETYVENGEAGSETSTFARLPQP